MQDAYYYVYRDFVGRSNILYTYPLKAGCANCSCVICFSLAGCVCSYEWGSGALTISIAGLLQYPSFEFESEGVCQHVQVRVVTLERRPIEQIQRPHLPVITEYDLRSLPRLKADNLPSAFDAHLGCVDRFLRNLPAVRVAGEKMRPARVASFTRTAEVATTLVVSDSVEIPSLVDPHKWILMRSRPIRS